MTVILIIVVLVLFAAGAFIAKTLDN